MLAELLLIGKLLDPLSKRSTPKATSPSTIFGRNGNGTDRISKPPTKKGPALELKKYF
jgi:hypothetical protein